MKNPTIVTIGGGTGSSAVLTGLKKKKYTATLKAIVAMADDGGSTKILREENGVLPPGSVRPALIALSDHTDTSLLGYESRPLWMRGHNMGNLLITALTKRLGSFEKAIEAFGKMLHAKGEVIPSTLEDIRLVVRLENGELVVGESNIDEPKHDGNLKVEKAWLEPSCKANPKAVDALKKADLVVIGPGDLYSSIIPNFLPEGMVEALQKSNAKKVYVCNIMTKYGETTGFKAHDFITTLEQYIGEGVIDCIVLNTAIPSQERVQEYEKEKAEFVTYNAPQLRDRNLKVIEADLLLSTGLIRHDPDVLARTLYSLLQ